MDSPLLSGWRRHFTADGVILSPPEQLGAGRIRIRPRVAPLRSVKSLVQEFLTPGAAVEGPLGFTTAEGEYGALLCETAGGAQRTVCFIMGDDWFASIEGVTRDPALFLLFRRTVERLGYEHCLGLGTDRWRRFFYDPPPGWSGIARGRSVGWLAPDYPKNAATIRAFDARPSRSTGPMQLFRRLFEQLPREFADVAASAPETLVTRHQLRGELVTYVVPGKVAAVDALLVDVRYVYFLRLECDEPQLAANVAVFRALLDTVRPLPTPSDIDAGTTSTTSSQWSE